MAQAAAAESEAKQEEAEPELYQPKGEWKTIASKAEKGDLDVYVLGNGKEGNVICVFYDIFGLHNLATDEGKDVDIPKSNNTLEFFDKVYAAGEGSYMVVVPNYLRDKPYSRKPDWNAFGDWWNSEGDPAKVVKEWQEVVMPYIEKEYEGFISFQVGALENEKVKGIAVFHPAKITEDACKAMTKPVYYVQTPGDFEADKAEAIFSKKAFAKQCKFAKTEQAHGFTSSGGSYRDAKWVKDHIEPVLANIKEFTASVYG